MTKKLVALAALVCLALAASAPAQNRKRKEPKGADYEFEKAKVALRYGLEDEGIKYLKQAIALDPNHTASYRMLGMVEFSKKNYAEAATAFEKYLELRPGDTEVLANLGYTHETLGQPDKAEAEYKQAIALDGNANAAFALARLYLGQKKLPEAADAARRAVAANAKSAPARNLLGVILNQMGQYAEAAASLEEARRLAPDDVNVAINLGIALINNKEYAKARELYEQVLPKVTDPAVKEKIEGYLKLIKDQEAAQNAEK